MHSQSPTSNATRYVDIRFVVANVMVCLPGPGPGVSDSTRPFEIAVSRSSIVAESANVAFSAGSSKEGNARRASVGSSWVIPYSRLLAWLR